jgi:molecular chaperone GrpE
MQTDDTEKQGPETTENEAPQNTDADDAPEAPAPIMEQERDQFKALAQRTQADFQNYKRRMDEERGMISRNASQQVVARLLPILDDLKRGVDSLPEEAPAAWGDGVKLIIQNLQALVAAEGVESFEPSPGDTFDPAQHEAVYYEPTADQPAGAVLSTVRPGYRGANRILRPAQVVVARELETTSGQ